MRCGVAVERMRDDGQEGRVAETGQITTVVDDGLHPVSSSSSGRFQTSGAQSNFPQLCDFIPSSPTSQFQSRDISTVNACTMLSTYRITLASSAHSLLVSQKISPWGFLTFSPKRLGIVVQILRAYYTFPIYARLQFFYSGTCNFDEVMPY